jgi:hypothetical protein
MSHQHLAQISFNLQGVSHLSQDDKRCEGRKKSPIKQAGEEADISKMSINGSNIK